MMSRSRSSDSEICCSVVPLKHVTLFILWLYFVIGVVTMCTITTINGEYQSSTTIEITGTRENPIIKYGIKETNENNYGSSIWTIILSGISAMVAIFAVYGYYQDISGHLCIFLFWEACVLVLIFVEPIIRFISTPEYSIIVPIIYFCFRLLCWIIVYRWYAEATRQNEHMENFCEEHTL